MPARASLTIGGRVVPGEPVEGATQALEGILAKLREDDGELGAYSILQKVAPAMEVAALPRTQMRPSSQTRSATLTSSR